MTTICLYFRGDGATRALESFRRGLGDEATLAVHPNRDDTGYYGSAEVPDVEAARAAFATARQPFPALKAYLGVLPPERDEAAPRPAQPRGGDQRPRQHDPRPGGGRPAEGRSQHNGSAPARNAERARPADANPATDNNGRRPLRHRGRGDRRAHGDRDKPGTSPQT